MGLKWLGFEGLSIFGIRVTIRRFPGWRKALIALNSDLLTRDQYFWKKKGGKPSSPGDLSGAKSKVVALTSSKVTSLRRKSLSSSEIILSKRSKSSWLLIEQDVFCKKHCRNALVIHSSILERCLITLLCSSWNWVNQITILSNYGTCIILTCICIAKY